MLVGFLLFKKRSYILLELVVACALIGLCAFPLVSGPMHMLIGEKKILGHMELERLAECGFADVYAGLREHTISWEELKSGKVLGPCDVHVRCGSGLKLKYERTCTLKTHKVKMGKDGFEHRLVTVKITFKEAFGDSITFPFFVYVKRDKNAL